MKTAVSLLNDLFHLAEAIARRLQLSRTQLSATATAKFLNNQQSDSDTDALNRIYGQLQATIDPSLQAAQFQSIDKDSW